MLLSEAEGQAQCVPRAILIKCAPEELHVERHAVEGSYCGAVVGIIVDEERAQLERGQEVGGCEKAAASEVSQIAAIGILL